MDTIIDGLKAYVMWWYDLAWTAALDSTVLFWAYGVLIFVTGMMMLVWAVFWIVALVIVVPVSAVIGWARERH